MRRRGRARTVTNKKPYASADIGLINTTLWITLLMTHLGLRAAKFYEYRARHRKCPLNQFNYYESIIYIFSARSEWHISDPHEKGLPVVHKSTWRCPESESWRAFSVISRAQAANRLHQLSHALGGRVL